MPIGNYYGGKGRAVMARMKKRYGKDAERVFYATSNKEKIKKKQPRRKQR